MCYHSPRLYSLWLDSPLRVLGASHSAPLTVSRHGAICASVLVSKLPDTLSLDYHVRHSWKRLRRSLVTLRLLAQKKDDGNPNWMRLNPYKTALFPDFSLAKCYFAALEFEKNHRFSIAFMS